MEHVNFGSVHSINKALMFDSIGADRSIRWPGTTLCGAPSRQTHRDGYRERIQARSAPI